MQRYHSWQSWTEAEIGLQGKLSLETINRLVSASLFAAQWHKGQQRPAGEPYLEHLLETLEIAIDAGITDDSLLVAALLHDVVEDTACTLEIVRARFGGRVASHVSWLTKAANESRDSYLARIQAATDPAVAVKLADRYSNVQRLHTHPSIEKQRRYFYETKNILVPLANRIPFYQRLYEKWLVAYRYLGATRVDSFDSAVALATVAHFGQTDKRGAPYIDHALAVADLTAQSGGTEQQRIAAVLHDVVEDTAVTLDQLRELGTPTPVLWIVDALSRRENETPPEYVVRIKNCPGAELIKRADLAHNTDPDRLSRLDQQTREKLQRKYLTTLTLLNSPSPDPRNPQPS